MFSSIANIRACGPVTGYTHRHTGTGHPIAYKAIMGPLMVTVSPHNGAVRLLRAEPFGSDSVVFLPVVGR